MAATARDVLAVGEFRSLWVAQIQSRVGDQLARVALMLLVYERTSSAFLTAAMFALTLLPPVLTAPLLSGLADRYSRRTVMVAVESLRAVLIAAAVLPGAPLPVIALLFVASSALQPLFAAARNATLPAVLPGPLLTVGMGIASITDNVAQILGFVVGGVSVAALGGPRISLLADAATFLASAVLLRVGIGAHRPAPDERAGAGRRGSFALAGMRAVGRDRRLLAAMALVWMYGFYLAPETLAAPYAHQVGAAPVWVGVLMAAGLLGAVVGAVAVTRAPPGVDRQRLTRILAVATGIPLVGNAVAPSLPMGLAMWCCAGAFSAYLILAQSFFTSTVPDAVRGRAIGLASAGLQTAQGLGALGAGALTHLVTPAVAVAISGAAGSLCTAAVWLAARPRRTLPVPTSVS